MGKYDKHWRCVQAGKQVRCEAKSGTLSIRYAQDMRKAEKP